MSDIRKKALELYKPPFTADGMGGYIFDSENQMVADESGGTHISQVRGWGRIGYLEEPEKLQDEVGAIIAEALNEYWEKHSEVH